MNDDELKRLLHEWKAPDAPSHLSAPRARRPRLDWLLTGSIRVPVPVAIFSLLLLGVWIVLRPQAVSLPESIARPPSGELARYALSGPLEGYEAVLVDLRFAAGASAPAHRHPGFVLGYVLSGQLRNEIDGGPEQIVPAGATFFEPTGVLHSRFGSGSPAAPVRVLAFLVVPTGSRLTEPG